jgi:hypothetical protein
MVLGLVGMLISNTLGAKFQSAVALLAGGLLLTASIAEGRTDAIVIAGAVCGLCGVFLWRERDQSVRRPSRAHWLSWSVSLGAVVLISGLGFVIGWWAFLFAPLAFLGSRVYRRALSRERRRRGRPGMPSAPRR